MEQNAIRNLIQHGLSALKAGSKVGAKATDEIQKDAHDSQLREMLERGNQTSKQWQERIDRALQEVGGEREEQNLVLEAMYDVSKKIRQQAPDDMTRDLGIIASAQKALHYWIAAFGTLRTYAAHAGLKQTEQEMQTCLEEAKQADEQHNQIAAHIFKTQAQKAA